MSWNGENRRRKKKVLLIDDDADLCRLFEIAAEGLDVLVTTVQTPYAFIEAFESAQYDAAFIDFGLSDYDGVDLLRLLHRDAAPATKVYLFTHYDLPIVKKKLNGDKIDGLLSKSESFSALLASIVSNEKVAAI